MKNYIIITIAAAGMAISAQAQTTLADLVQPMTPGQVLDQNRANIAREARTNSAFYTAIKANGYAFDGVALTPAQVAQLQFTVQDFDGANNVEAAKSYTLPQYKSYVAHKLLSLGNDTIAGYDWVQAQRLAVVQSQTPSSYTEKLEFLDALGGQILAAAKAKQD